MVVLVGEALLALILVLAEFTDGVSDGELVGYV